MTHLYKWILPCAAMLIGACSDSNDDGIASGNDPFDFSVSHEYSLLAVGDDALTLASTSRSCGAGAAVRDRQDTIDVEYSFEGNSLILNDLEDCDFTLNGGSKGDLQGTWNVEEAKSRYGASEDKFCMGDNNTIQIKITSSSLKVTQNVHNYCWAEDEWDFYSEESVPAGVTISTEGCGRIIFRDSSGNTLIRGLEDINVPTRTSTTVLAYNGTECSFRSTAQEASPSVCAEAWDNFQKYGHTDDDDYEWDEWANYNVMKEFLQCRKGLDVSEALRDYR